jgi:histone-lysine N-methyltransferase SETMAR
MHVKEKICIRGLLLGTNLACVTTISWEGCAYCVLGFSGVLLAHFQKRGENVNSALYCDVLSKLWDTVRIKRPGQLARGVLPHHDNARPHTAWATQERIQELQWELPEHLPYTSDLVPSNFHLFGPLKNHIGDDDEEVETGVEVAETTVKRLLCCGFWHTGKVIGQVYQCWWRICREINVFSRFEYHVFYILYKFVTCLLLVLV